jgi:hypothetical protein
MSSTEKKLWGVAGVTTVAVALIAFLSYLYTWELYYKTLPHSADKTAGRVYADNFHGFARYETPSEYLRLHRIEDLSEVFVFLVVGGGVLYEWRVRQPAPPSSRN